MKFSTFKKEDSLKDYLCAIEFLSFFSLALDAGMGIQQAFLKSASEVAPSNFSNEIASVKDLLQSSLSFSEALREIEVRSQSSLFKDISSSLFLSLRLGVDLKRTVDDKIQNLSERLQYQAEGEAGKAPVKMLFPLMVFIFPIIFLLLGAGVVMDLADVLR